MLKKYVRFLSHLVNSIYYKIIYIIFLLNFPHFPSDICTEKPGDRALLICRPLVKLIFEIIGENDGTFHISIQADV